MTNEELKTHLKQFEDDRYITVKEDIAVIKTKMEEVHRILTNNGIIKKIETHEVRIAEITTTGKVAIAIIGVLYTILAIVSLVVRVGGAK